MLGYRNPKKGCSFRAVIRGEKNTVSGPVFGPMLGQCWAIRDDVAAMLGVS